MSLAVVLPGSINAPLGSQSEQGGAYNSYGQTNITEVTGISSDIPISSAPQNVLTFSAAVEILNLVMMTDPTGLAGGTNFEVLTDDPSGAALIMSEAESNLGANKTIDGNTALSFQKMIIRATYHLQIGSTGAASTGSGAWKLYVYYRPLSWKGSASPLN